MRYIFARIAGVDISLVTVGAITTYDASSTRRLLVDGSQIEFIINIPVADEPISVVTENAEIISREITTEIINEIIDNDPELSVILPDGVLSISEPDIVPPTEILSESEDVEPILFIIIGASASVLILVIIIVSILCCYCKKKNGHNNFQPGYSVVQPHSMHQSTIRHGIPIRPSFPPQNTHQRGLPPGFMKSNQHFPIPFQASQFDVLRGQFTPLVQNGGHQSQTNPSGLSQPSPIWPSHTIPRENYRQAVRSQSLYDAYV
jgi:hypothetical protein